MSVESCEIAVIGAGAAGLAAGIFAGEAGKWRGKLPRIVVLDGAKAVGAKILVSGGGRCNVTHDEIDPARDYHGSKHIVRNVLAAFGERAAVRWFEGMGVRLKCEETGKLFPVSDSARTVLDALLRRCAELEVEVRNGCRVLDVDCREAGQSPGQDDPRLASLPECRERENGGLVLRHDRGELRARRVIVATGGRSLPKTGSDGSFYDVLRRLGHSVTPTCPALVPLVLEEKFFHGELSGLSQEVELSTFVDRKLIDRRRGSLLWTHFGVSGPVVMDASRFWVIAHGEGRSVEVRCSLVAGRTFEEVEASLIAAATEKRSRSIGRVVGEWVPERVGEALLRACGVDASMRVAQVPKDSRRRIVGALTGLSLPVVRDRGWNYAEVTAGGVPLEEINYRTMESRKMAGLHLVGEVLDCDGRIGGFNFQWAWATGFLAGRAVVEGLPTDGHG